MDTTDPPGGEKPVVDYLKQVLEAEGIPVQIFAMEGQAHRPNLVARIKGNGTKRPLLIMGHTDTVNVDPKKWTHPPFGAVRDGGWVYGRGTVDDKDNVIASLMTMLMLKRLNVRARPRRHLPGRSRRGRQLAPRHPVHGQPALRRDRRRVLLRRRRQRRADRRRREVRPHPDGRENPARDHRDGQGHCRARLGPARDQRARPPRRGGRRDRGLDAAAAHQRNHRGLLQAPGLGLDTRRSGALSRRARIPIRRSRGPPTPTCARTNQATGRCCAPRCRRR